MQPLHQTVTYERGGRAPTLPTSLVDILVHNDYFNEVMLV